LAGDDSSRLTAAVLNNKNCIISYLISFINRPPVGKLFRADVIAALQTELEFEKLIYQRAREQHVQMLADLNLTVETAKAQWLNTCI
jgi:hypothetical protein